MECFCSIYHDDIPYRELIVPPPTVDSTITAQYSSASNGTSSGELTFCGSFDSNATHFLRLSLLYVPVYTDLSNNNMTVVNNSLYSTSAPTNVLSNVICQYMATSKTNTLSSERKSRSVAIVDKVLLV